MFDILSFIIQVLKMFMYVYVAHRLLGREMTYRNKLIIGVYIVVLLILIGLFETELTRNIFVLTIFISIILYIITDVGLSRLLITAFVSINFCFMIKYTIIAFFSATLDTPPQLCIDNLFINYLMDMVSLIFITVFYLILKKYKLCLFDCEKNCFSVDKLFLQDRNILSRIKVISNDYNPVIILFIIQMTLTTYYFYSREFSPLYISGKSEFGIELKIAFLSVAIITLNIFTLFIEVKVQKMREESYQNKIKEIHYSQIEKESLIIKQYKHDLHNHLNLLCGLVEEKKYDEIHSYLNNFNEDVKSKTIPVKTGLNELDVLLYSKINRAQQNNIKIEYNCSTDVQCAKNHIINFIPIIGNLLDNAIEASQHSKNRIIGINIDEDVLDYIFIIKNTFENKEVQNPKMFLQEGFTTKGIGRGLGLKIVNKLVKKYNGNIEFNKDEEFFLVKVTLPKYELE